MEREKVGEKGRKKVDERIRRIKNDKSGKNKTSKQERTSVKSSCTNRRKGPRSRKGKELMTFD